MAEICRFDNRSGRSQVRVLERKGQSALGRGPCTSIFARRCLRANMHADVCMCLSVRTHTPTPKCMYAYMQPPLTHTHSHPHLHGHTHTHAERERERERCAYAAACVPGVRGVCTTNMCIKLRKKSCRFITDVIFYAIFGGLGRFGGVRPVENLAQIDDVCQLGLCTQTVAV